jgi:hypothetical protein
MAAPAGTKAHQQAYDLGSLLDLTFLNEFAADGAGTSKSAALVGLSDGD